MQFLLHPRLLADTITLGDLALSRLLLMNDSRFPWVVMVPRRNNILEIIDLNHADQIQLFSEIQSVLEAVRIAFEPDKLNLGAIGNLVPQLHVHIIARFENDAAWPNPVWGFGHAVSYNAADVRLKVVAISSRLKFLADWECQ